jgi:DNA-binding PadR family transcriptional regulator
MGRTVAARPALDADVPRLLDIGRVTTYGVDMKPATSAPLGDVTMLILTALADDDRHGYGIMTEVRTLSEGRVKLGTGTLYGALERMLDADQVRVVREEMVEGRLRRYYRITDHGRSTLLDDLDRREQQVRAARVRLLGAT